MNKISHLFGRAVCGSGNADSVVSRSSVPPICADHTCFLSDTIPSVVGTQYWRIFTESKKQIIFLGPMKEWEEDHKHTNGH
jgi:hypothetical protein